MNKRFLLLFMIIFCSGCSVKYEMNIDSMNQLDEKINFYAESSSDRDKIGEFDQFIPIDYHADDYSVFEKRLEGTKYYNFSRRNDNSNMRFSYSYDIDSVKDDFFAHRCFEYVTFKKNSVGNKKDSEIILSTSKKFLCFKYYDNLENVDVSIYSKYKLKDTNADEVGHHKYIWHFNRNNGNDKFIYLLLDATDRDLSFWESLLEGNSFSIFAIAVVILIFSGIIFMLFKKKGQIRNKI